MDRSMPGNPGGPRAKLDPRRSDSMPDVAGPEDEPGRQDSMPDIPSQSLRSTSSGSMKRDMSTMSAATSQGTICRVLKGRGPLEAELVDSYYWSGSMLKDYFFFVRQWQPVLAICLHHKRHPYTRKMRLFVFLVTVFFPMAPSGFIEYQTEKATGGEKASWWKLFLMVTLPSDLLGYILYKISIMDRRCAPKMDRVEFCDRLFACVLRMLATLFKAGCYFCVTMTMVAPLVVFLVYEAGSTECDFCSWRYMFQPWCISMITSFLSWFPLHFFMPITGFLWHWTKEHREGKAPLENVERLEVERGYQYSQDILA